MALYQQEFFIVPAVLERCNGFQLMGVMPAPQRDSQCCYRLGVVVERDFRFDAKSGRRRNGMGDVQPERIEMVEPERQVVAVGFGGFFLPRN